MPLVGRAALAVLLVGVLAIALADPFTTMFYVVYAVPGVILVFRRPREVVGWLLILLGFGFVGTTLPLDLDFEALAAGTATWRDFVFVWISAWAGYATFSVFVALTLVFPTGRLPDGWRPLALVLLAVCAVVCAISLAAPKISITVGQGVATVLVPNRLAVLPDSPAWALLPTDWLIVPMVLCFLVGVGWMLVRYRRATGVERLQLRWLVASLAAVVAAVTAGLGSLAILGDIGGLAWIPAICAYPTVPIAILFAVTRYRLYDIDRIISRTVGWLAVTGMLALVFAGAVVGLQALLAPVTANNTLAVAGSTLLAAALFQPLRARVQRAVDRRFNRARIDAQRAVDTLAARLRDEVALGAVHADLLGSVDAAVQPTRVSVWIRGEGRS
ncbi:MAG TPA: hypothetical protein VFY23_16080 [Candidatus Limnocylindrales bacterium]|nr:hypothetical protein [Candidatus Limnocylindrales bacterium]